MATFQKRGKAWRVMIRRRGYLPQTKTFDRKADAEAWARVIEGEIDRGIFIDRTVAERTTLSEALDRYAREVSPTKRGGDREIRKIEKMRRHPLALRSLASLRGQDIADYRDERLKEVSANTVRLDLAILSHLFTMARKEWGLGGIANPVADIRKPKLPPGRNRRLEDGEEQRLLDQAATSRNPWLRPMIELALETAMRQGELLSLTWSNVNFAVRTIHLDLTKNGDSRTVPLSPRAVEVLRALPQDIRGRVFPTTQMAIIKSFTHACKAADIEGLRFHDLRHEATSRFFEQTDLRDMEIMSITGHKSPVMLARYAHLRGRQLVDRLSQGG